MAAEKSRDMKLKNKIINSLKVINTEAKKAFRHKLAEAIFNCDDGEELSVIFKMYEIDKDPLLFIFSRIYRSLQEEIGKIGSYIIEPYEIFAEKLSLDENHVNLHIYYSTSEDGSNISFNIAQMLDQSKQFSNVVTLQNYLIVQCVHIDTGYTLKIDISEPYDLHNSKLFINQLKEEDSRINELMLFLMIWFKNMHIYKFMTQDCLMTLIIFYLQNCYPPVLLSIKTVQKNRQQCVRNGICMNFTQNIHQMMKGFFKFYRSFDFRAQIIVPYLATVIRKADFSKKVYNHTEYETHMLNSGEEEFSKEYAVWVQDMFFFNKNLGKDISQLNFEYLKLCITMAHEKFLKSKKSTKNLYKSLFVDIIDELKQIFDSEDTFTMQIFPLTSELKSLARFASTPLDQRKLWIKAYITAIPQIITAIFKIDMTLVPPTATVNCKFKKMEETEELQLPLKWSICSSVDLWRARNLKTSRNNFIESQLAETEKLYMERRNKSEFAVQLEGFITISITKNFNSLHIEASSNEVCKQKIKPLVRLFGTLKYFLPQYNLVFRTHLLESQLQKSREAFD